VARGFLRLARKQGRRPLASCGVADGPSPAGGGAVHGERDGAVLRPGVVLAAGRSFGPRVWPGDDGQVCCLRWMVAVAIAAVSLVAVSAYALVTDTGASEPGKTSAVNLLCIPCPNGSLFAPADHGRGVYLPGPIRSVPPAEAASLCFDEAVKSWGPAGPAVTPGNLALAGRPRQTSRAACTLESFANTRLPVRRRRPPWPCSSSNTTRVGAHWSTEKPHPCCGPTCSCERSRCPPVPSYRASVPRVWAALAIFLSVDGLLGPVVLVATARGGHEGIRVPEPGVVDGSCFRAVMLDANMPPMMKTALGRPPAAPETTPPAGYPACQPRRRKSAHTGATSHCPGTGR